MKSFNSICLIISNLLGSTIGTSLVIQVITGFITFMNFETTSSFDRTDRITQSWMIDVIRSGHISYASDLNLLAWLHLFRSIYIGSRKKSTWTSGYLELLRILVESIFGYSLVDSTLSHSALSILIHLLRRYPLSFYFPHYLTKIFLTNRFLLYHFLLPFLIVGLTALHLLILHETSSRRIRRKDRLETICFEIFYLLWDYSFWSLNSWITLRIPLRGGMLDDPTHYLPNIEPLKHSIEHETPHWYVMFLFGVVRAWANMEDYGLICITLILSIYLLVYKRSRVILVKAAIVIIFMLFLFISPFVLPDLLTNSRIRAFSILLITIINL